MGQAGRRAGAAPLGEGRGRGHGRGERRGRPVVGGASPEREGGAVARCRRCSPAVRVGAAW